jgi:hypothetical protein
LQGFVNSEQKMVKFWTLRPNELKAYKLKARKVGHETLKIANESMDTIKVELRLTGWLAPFWNSFYWFRAKDGLFVKFEGPTDATGETHIIINYTGSTSTSEEKPSKMIQPKN